jgi:hypothetical protein
MLIAVAGGKKYDDKMNWAIVHSNERRTRPAGMRSWIARQFCVQQNRLSVSRNAVQETHIHVIHRVAVDFLPVDIDIASAFRWMGSLGSKPNPQRKQPRRARAPLASSIERKATPTASKVPRPCTARRHGQADNCSPNNGGPRSERRTRAVRTERGVGPGE